MPTDPALPSVERLDELMDDANMVKPDTYVCDVIKLTYGELRALLSAARLVPVLMAEAEAWRKWETKLWQDLDGIAKPQPPYLPGAMRDKTNAIATTDAALARAGVKMGEKR